MGILYYAHQITDAETGEVNQESLIFDHETGETFDYSLLVNPRPTTNEFHVPRSYLSDDPNHSQTSQNQRRRRQNRGIPRRDQCEVTLGYKPTHKLFLIPSLFFFFKITALVLLFCELVLHIWAHRMNYRNKDSLMFYRSPLHLISSQFCAHCTSEVRMIKLGRIQDKRREAKRLVAFSGPMG